VLLWTNECSTWRIVSAGMAHRFDGHVCMYVLGPEGRPYLACDWVYCHTNVSLFRHIWRLYTSQVKQTLVRYNKKFN
jgi:hypothetical protein